MTIRTPLLYAITPDEEGTRYNKRRMRRRLCQIAAVVCLLCCGATVALSIRSEATVDRCHMRMRSDWACTALARRGILFIGAWGMPAVGPRGVGFRHWRVRPEESMWSDGDHHFCGFGWTVPNPDQDIHALFAPLWFVALLWILLAYLSFRVSRRRLNTGHGFPVLPTPHKTTP